MGDRAGAHPYFRVGQPCCQPSSKDRVRLRIESWNPRIHRLYRMKAGNYGAVPATSLVGFSRELMTRGVRVNDLVKRERASSYARKQSSHGGSRNLARWLFSRVNDARRAS